MSISLLVAMLSVLSGMPPTDTDSILDRADQDDIALAPQHDPEMEAAFAHARATLPGFLGLAQAPRSGITSMAVKVGLDEGDDTEYFWISNFVERDGWITGRIDNTPRLVKRVRNGEEIGFATEDVVDWLYRENGKMFGNFTGCVLLRRQPLAEAEEFKRRFGLNCDK